ncbi:hypothetical protein MOMOMA043M_18585 [Morganella morganii]
MKLFEVVRCHFKSFYFIRPIYAPSPKSPCYTPIITHHYETNMHNIANLTQDEKDKINADLAAAGIAHKERLGLPYDLYETENQQPEHLRPYFRERLEHYREVGKRLPRGFEYEKE